MQMPRTREGQNVALLLKNYSVWLSFPICKSNSKRYYQSAWNSLKYSKWHLAHSACIVNVISTNRLTLVDYTTLGPVGIWLGSLLHVKAESTPSRGIRLSRQKPLGYKFLWWGHQQRWPTGLLSSSQACHRPCLAKCAKEKKNVYGDLICFPFYYSFFQRPGTAEIKPRQGPGEQTGPGPGPEVMKWKMFTPQAALQCTCTNSRDLPTPPYQGPTASQSFFFYSFTPCLARSILGLWWR